MTDRQDAQADLLASERRFRALTENGHDVITLVGPDGTILYSSPNDQRVLGYSSEETLGSNAMDYVHPDDLETLGQLLRELVEDPNGTSKAEFRVRHGDGSWVWVETLAQNRLGEADVRAIVLNTRDISDRKLAEEELRRTEQKYRTLVEGLPGIVYMDPPVMDRSTLYVSPQVEQMLGYPPEHFTSDVNAWYEIIHPEDIRAEITEELAAFEQDRPTQMEYRIRTRDGRVLWMADHSEPITDEKGENLYWLGVMLDVTERKAAEARLREADARYRMLVENMPAVSYVEPPGEDPELFYMSPQITSLLGYDPEDFRDPDFWNGRIHPEDRERVIAEDRRVTESHERFLFEYRMIAADGSIVWIRDEAVFLDGGDAIPSIPSFWQGFLIDITERKRAEQRLREAEAKYRTLVEHVPAVVYADTDTPIGVTTYLSPQIEVMLGYTPEEFIAQPDLWDGVIHPDDLERQQAAEIRSFEAGQPYNIEYRCVARDGRIVWVEDRSAPVRDEEGRILFWQGVMVDITKLKEAEQELTRALEMEREVTRRLRAVDDMKDAFLTAVSHELRTPLTSVVGSAITLETLDGSLPADDRRALLTSISTGAKKLDRLVRDLLDMDRLSRGVLSPKRQPVDLAEVADRVIEGSDLRSSREIVRQLGEIVAAVDVAMFERILENLLVNADKHTPAGARIWIRAVRQEGGVLLVVEDDGPGVPEPARARIFEPFVRGTAAVDHAPGVGVGLSLVAQFAQLHGGRAWLEDRAGGGSSFRVFLADDGQAAVRG